MELAGGIGLKSNCCTVYRGLYACGNDYTSADLVNQVKITLTQNFTRQVYLSLKGIAVLLKSRDIN